MSTEILSETKIVFVVDDEVLIRETLTAFLSRYFSVRAFECPKHALAAVDGGANPVVLISDYSMPEMNGLELIAEAKRRLPDLRTLLFSANASVDLINDAEAKPDVFIKKPGSLAQLHAAVSQLLG